MHVLITKLTAEHLQQMTSCSERLANASQICGEGCGSAEYRELWKEMGLDCILTSQMEFALQVLLRHLQIPERHADVFVTEQLHERGQVDARYRYRLAGDRRWGAG